MGAILSAGGEVPAAAVAAAVAVAGRAMFADAEQVEMALGDRPDRGIGEAVREVKGRGRPKGSLNQRTGDWRDYLASQYRHPLVTLAMIQAEDPDKLAAELGCKPIEALSVIKSAAAELAPYMEGRMPVVIEARGKGHMSLFMLDAGGMAALAQGKAEGAGDVIEQVMPLGFASERNQGVSGAGGDVSE